MDDFDEMDKIFRLLREMMDSDFSGGYSIGGPSRRSTTSSDNKTDIQEDDEHIYITLELKVEDENLSVKPYEDRIEIEIMMDGAWRKHTIRLQKLVIPKSAKISFKNHVLDIELKKKRENVNARV